MLRGGRITARHDIPGSSPILEITLSTPLQVGQTASLEYQAAFGPAQVRWPSTGRSHVPMWAITLFP
jgi:hypothetical protein